MHTRRYHLVALVLSVFTLSAPQRGAAASGATIAAASLSATSSISELASMMGRLAARERALSHHLNLHNVGGFSA